MSLYTYSDNDLIEAPNHYSYTKFHGVPFFEHWRASRSRFIQENKDFAALPELRPLTLAQLDFQDDTILESSQVLFTLLTNLNNDRDYHRLAPKLHLLLKRFEVTKKIYEGFTANFRAEDKTKCRNFDSYLLSSDLFAKSYRLSAEIPYLNGLLKINDTLCSQFNNLNQNQRAYLSKLLLEEKELVLKLLEKTGVHL